MVKSEKGFGSKKFKKKINKDNYLDILQSPVIIEMYLKMVYNFYLKMHQTCAYYSKNFRKNPKKFQIKMCNTWIYLLPKILTNKLLRSRIR